MSVFIDFTFNLIATPRSLSVLERFGTKPTDRWKYTKDFVLDGIFPTKPVSW